MNSRELKYYEEIGNWDFSKIKYKTENRTEKGILLKRVLYGIVAVK